MEVLQLVSHSLGSKLNFSHLVFEIKIGEIIVLGPIVSDLWSAVLNRTFEYVFLEEHFPSVPEELSSAAVTGQREAQSSVYKRLPGLMVPFLLLNNF